MILLSIVVIVSIGMFVGRRLDIQRDIANLIDEAQSVDQHGHEIHWQTTSSIDVATNKFISPFEWDL